MNAAAREPGRAAWPRLTSIRAGVLMLGLLGCAGREPVPQAPESSRPVPPAVGPTASALPQVDRSRLPEPEPVAPWEPVEPRWWRLSNGIRVVYAEHGITPLVTAILVLPRGSAVDPPGKAGLTALVADLLDEGAAGKSALEIAEEWRKLGTSYKTSVGLDAIKLVLHSLAETLVPSLELLGELVERPEPTRAEFERCRQQRIAQALAREADPASARWVVERRVVFGDGYGGDLPRGSRSTLSRITYEDVLAHQRRVIAAEGAELVVVGGVEEGVVRDASERVFGRWQGRGRGEPRALTSRPVEPGLYLIDFPGAAQSSVALVRRIEGASSPDYFPALVYGRVLGGSFMSRLNLNLRENKGYTYGAYTRLRRYKKAGCLELEASVATEQTRASIEEMLAELEAIRGSRPISEAEYQDASQGLLLGFPGQFERVSDVARGLARVLIQERGLDWLRRWPERLRSVTLEEVRRVAQTYSDPRQFAIVISGDRGRLMPSLEQLGLPIVLYDAQGRRLDSHGHAPGKATGGK